MVKNIFYKNAYNYNYKIIYDKKYFIYLTLYEECSERESYNCGIIDLFLIISYISDMKIFYLYKYYISKWDFLIKNVF